MTGQRFQFETNVDEQAEANERFWISSRAGQSQRRRGVATTAAAFTGTTFSVAFAINGAAPRAALPVALMALLLGAACWPLYGRLYDSGFRRRLRRVVAEEAGEQKTWTCEVELRSEGAWCRSRGIEFLFNWHQLSAIEDIDQGIELRFRAGYLMIRSRAFATAADREGFLAAAKRLAQLASRGTSA